MARRGIVGSLLILVLALVPALVRATERTSPSPGQFRLVRGFDAPESKFRVASPPRGDSPAELAVEHTTRPHVVTFVTTADESPAICWKKE